MAEIVGLIVAIPGLVQSCLLAYKALVTSASMTRESRSLLLSLEIEGNRLMVAGKGLGLVDLATSLSQDPKTITTLIRQRIPNDASVHLVHRILDNMHHILTDLEKLSRRYGFDIEASVVGLTRHSSFL